jgi:tRNA threonylcarbamoyladenosine biosynthesis protein TsaB
MLILTLRTDKPEAELGLFEDEAKLEYVLWPAHRELAETIQLRIDELLTKHGKKLESVQGIVAYQGPGSFTGLRIGLTVANALAYSLKVPIVASAGDQWVKLGQSRLTRGESDQLALPEYGSPVHITLPKK